MKTVKVWKGWVVGEKTVEEREDSVAETMWKFENVSICGLCNVNTLMQEVSASLLMEFEKWVLQA